MKTNNLDFDELYTKEIDGKWTLEGMHNYAKDLYRDDGNEIADAEDIYPRAGVPSTAYSVLCSGVDASYIRIVPNPYSMEIPYCIDAPERIGFALEAMVYHSTDTVRATYFEIRLCGQTSRDALFRQTLDLIYSNIAYSIPIESTISYSSAINDMMVEGSRKITSYIQSVKPSMKKDIEKFINEVD